MDNNMDRENNKKINYAGIFRKIDDIPELRIELEKIFNSKSHKEMAKYSLLLGHHILKITNTDPCNEIIEGFEINKKWQIGEPNKKGFAKFQESRNVAGKILTLARKEKDPIKACIYRVMAQIVNIPHVKNHALWASDYAIKLINKLYPNNFDEVKKERETQIELKVFYRRGFMIDTISVGRQIAHLRKQTGLTQEELAEKFGITAQAISKWENGHTLPDTVMLPSLAKFFRRSIDSILMPSAAEENAFQDFACQAGGKPGELALALYQMMKSKLDFTISYDDNGTTINSRIIKIDVGFGAFG
ncbi:MAG: helix-turn-helix domain-containing protein [Treponema sp.]|jgi:transcriptional regulator with XRE-family HTH domain|nr:helix-turn-helix domain-containing protein [Treponema sp.]